MDIEKRAQNIVRNEVFVNGSMLVSELTHYEELQDQLTAVTVHFPVEFAEDQYRYSVEIDGDGDDYLAHVYHIDPQSGSEIGPVFTVTGGMFSDGELLADLDRDDTFEIMERISAQKDSPVPYAFDILDEDDEPTEVEGDPVEALEHWIVSDWLATKLDAEGEMVCDFKGLNIWGRTTSGQAIYMDHVIQQIANKAGGLA